VAHATLSASAIAKTCLEADALATVFMVMPPEEALRLADSLRTPALLVSRVAGEYHLQRGSAWPAD
jgi:thiamine biosynthesis lipoprotein ApbE